MASIIPVRYFFITLPSPVRAPGHRGVGLSLRAELLREQHREVAEYGVQDARNGLADRESDPGTELWISADVSRAGPECDLAPATPPIKTAGLILKA